MCVDLMMKSISLCFALLMGLSCNCPLFAQDTLNTAACFSCHADKALTGEKEGDSQSMFVHQTGYRYSVHGKLQCIECHTGIQSLPHPPDLAKPKCASCHTQARQNLNSSVHGEKKGNLACLDCHDDPHLTLAVSNKNSPVHRNQVRELCAKCHASDANEALRHASPRMVDAVKKYKNSVHGHAYRSGKMHAAGCVDCHGHHSILPGYDPRSTVHRFNIFNQCNTCHKKIVAQYKKSVHGMAIQNKVADAPVCTVCHEEHTIQSPKTPASPVYKTHVAQRTCARCHDSIRLATRYGFPADRYDSYMASFHGIRMKKGELNAAHCASCHGVHNILPSSNPASTIHPDNLVSTCGGCHVVEIEQIAAIDIHPGGNDRTYPVVAFVGGIYRVGIPVVVFLALLHNLTIYGYYLSQKVKRMKAEGKPMHSTFEAVKHLVLIGLFAILVITGFAFHFPHAWWSEGLAAMGISEPGRAFLHRLCALGLVGLAFLHVSYSILSPSGRRKLQLRLPGFRDVRDFFAVLKCPSDSCREPGEDKPITYIQKIEYWTLLWGILFMTVSGVLLWFPFTVLQIFPAWVLELAQVVHYYEAVMAVATILLWHFFHAVFHPKQYPMRISLWKEEK
ncbi:hypothetical protein GF373_10220, partial [bacterium]|nr:hypothetical protein [bacterium]